jgi:uncharacterized protein
MRKTEKEVTDSIEIESIINDSDVCRIAFAVKEIPYIVTLNFGYVGGDEKKLYFHCANEGRKLDMIRKNNYVCFEMDCDHQLTPGKKACDFGMKYKSIIGYGNITIIEGSEEKMIGFNAIMSHYVNGGSLNYDKTLVDGSTILRLDIQEFTGKKS